MIIEKPFEAAHEYVHVIHIMHSFPSNHHDTWSSARSGEAYFPMARFEVEASTRGVGRDAVNCVANESNSLLGINSKTAVRSISRRRRHIQAVN